MMTSKLFALIRPALLLLVIGLTGCNGNVGMFPYARMAPMGPPDPIIEEKVVAEDPTVEYWRPGYWDYDGFNFTWIPGELILRPDPTAVWMADRWELRSYGWAFIPGFWL